MNQKQQQWLPQTLLSAVNKKKFFDEASAKAQPYLNEMENHPFFKELIAGTLNIKRAKFYTTQLSFYLTKVARALSVVAGRFEKPEEVKSFSEFSTFVLSIQKSFADFYPGAKPEESLTCQGYTGELLATASLSEAVSSAVAALLPSCWVHLELINYLSKQNIGPNNPYKEWVKMFSTEGFDQVAQGAIDTTNQIAEKATLLEREKMLNRFLVSSEMELKL